MLLQTYTYSENNLSAKRIYISDDISIFHTCPECNEENEYPHQVPFISYGTYCHSFHCQHCGWEVSDKMCTLNEVYEDEIDVTFSKMYNFEVYGYEYVKVKLDTE